MTVVPFPSPDREPEPEPSDVLDVYSGESELTPVLPEWASSVENLRHALRHHAGRTWHLTVFHGVRVPQYAFRTLGWSVVGAGRLGRRLLRWWHWTDGWVLESMAVAAGRAGHADAMRAHTEGKKTRGKRGQIVFWCAAGLLAAVLSATQWMPWYGWAAAGALVLLGLAWHGRPAGRTLIEHATVAPRYERPTPQVITRGLASLGIPSLTQAAGDGRIVFITDPHRDGDGWRADIDLPHGVTARMILQRREQLSSGLMRPLSAVWPEGVPHEHEGRLLLWIGYDDLSKLKQRDYPLLRAGSADVFGALPFGTDPRGRPVTAPLFEVNWLIGAAPGQGKTAAVRVLALGAALDPVCDLWVHELAGKGDMEPLEQVSHRYVSGLDDDSIEYAAESLTLLRDMLEHRSAAFKRLPKEQRPDGKLTRELASRKGLGLRPVLAIFDECQNLFTHPTLGKQAADDAGYVIRLGRAYGIMLVFSTQRPDKDMLPTQVSGNVTARLCMRVPGYQENDMILGTGAHKAGYKATVFRARTDAGLGWFKGDGDPAILRTYYLDLPTAARIAARAKVMRQQAGVLSGHAIGQDHKPQARSLAADVLSVFGADRNLWCTTIAGRLAHRLPDVYADITAAAVADQLRALGVEVKQVRESGAGVRAGCERRSVAAAAGVADADE